MDKKIKFTGQELAEKLGIKVNAFPTLSPYGHSFIQPSQLFDQKAKITMPEEDYNVLRRIENEGYNTGEIWHAAYDIVYLYLGKIGDQDLIFTLGGDTPYAGKIERPKEGISDGSYQFLRRVFPR